MIYEYECQDCGAIIEIHWPISSERPWEAKCECGGKATRKVSKCNFALKGGGWAKDGYE